MPGINFGNIGSSSPSETATEPRKIFAALPRKDAKYSYPRDVQAEVWEAWHRVRDEADVVVKMNTGGGKTVVGLLALKSCLNEGVGPAMYLTPSKLLTAQVLEEAAALGVPTAEDPKDARFRQGRSILVANIFKLFNGLSQFGVERGARPPVDVGSILVDDAHACLDIMQEQFSIRLPRKHAAYDEIFSLVRHDLRAQSSAKALEVENGDPTAALSVPWWAWQRECDSVARILYGYKDDNEVKFTWPLIAESLALSNVAISGRELTIAPPVPPVDTIPSFRSAKRRIYLSATLNDDSVIVTHFGADPQSISGPVTPSTAGDIGDRLILTPYETHRGVQEEEVMDLVEEISKSVNTVVIVPSDRRAELWKDRADAVHDTESIEEGVRDLRNGHVGLVVLVSRYDGIDLPGDACRILVLDGLPEAHSPLEQMESAALHGSPVLLQRQLRRIEQGMGRGVRSNDDHCVIILLGHRLTERIHVSDARTYFSPASYAQIALSQQVTEMIEGESFSMVRGVIQQVLDRDVEWIAANRRALENLVYDDRLQISPEAVTARHAFILAQAGRYGEAADALSQAANRTVISPRERGWMLQQAASYMNHMNSVRAQKIQASAKQLNLSLMKPEVGIKYRKLSRMKGQAARATEYLSQAHPSTDEFVLRVRAKLSDLRPSDNYADVDAFEAAMAEIGRTLGFESQRPDKEFGNGPDVLWHLGNHVYLVIECKSGTKNDFISRTDIEQLSHSMDWFGTTYGDEAQGVPILIHPSSVLHDKAFPRPGTVVLTLEALDRLKAAVDALVAGFSSGGALSDAEGLAAQLRAHGLGAGELVQSWCVAPTRRG